MDSIVKRKLLAAPIAGMPDRVVANGVHWRTVTLRMRFRPSDLARLAHEYGFHWRYAPYTGDYPPNGDAGPFWHILAWEESRTYIIAEMTVPDGLYRELISPLSRGKPGTVAKSIYMLRAEHVTPLITMMPGACEFRTSSPSYAMRRPETMATQSAGSMPKKPRKRINPFRPY